MSKAMDLFLLFHKKGLVLSLATITAFALNTFHACVTLKNSPPIEGRHEWFNLEDRCEATKVTQQ